MNLFLTRRVFVCLNAILLTCMMLVFVTSANAQYTTSTGMPTFTTALPVEMGFTNVANGNLHLEIPLASFPQRGSLSYNARLVYDSLIWTIDTNAWKPTNVPNSMGGWRLVTGGEPGTVTNVAGTSFCDTPPPLNNRTFHVAFVWSSPDGTSHRFPIFTQHDTTICAEDTPSDSAMADDSSGYFMSVTGYTNATVYAPDGTQVFPTVMDTNGNFMSVSSGDIVDTLGRKPITTTTSAGTITYTVMNPIGTGTSTLVTVATQTVSAHTAFGQTGVTECSTSCSFTAIQSITISNGTPGGTGVTSYAYNFTYDSGTTSGHYGELTGMTLTTGGSITYGYSNFTDGAGNHSRWLSQKIAGTNTWTYAPTSLGSTTQKVTVTDCLSNTITYNFSLNNGAWMGSSTYHDNILGDLMTVTNSWDTSNSCPSNSNCTGAAFVRKNSISYSFPSGLKKLFTYVYASSVTGQVSEIDESDYASSTPPALRKTLFTYASLTNTVTKLHQITVEDISGTTVSQTTYTYDGSTPTSTTGVPQHSSSASSRGNPTTITHLVGGTTTLSTVLTYDDTGNVLTSTDPASDVISFDYTDNFNGGILTGTNAYPTKITLPSVGSVTHITHTKYDGNTGLPVTDTDLNGNQTTYTYDFVSRPVAINAPDGGQISFTYPSVTSVVKSRKMTATQSSSSTTIMDTYGRVKQQQLTTDPDGTVYIDTTYDGNGRVNSVSNPHRTVPPASPDPTDGNTSYSYDVLGRIIKQTQPDGNFIQLAYSDNCITTTDEVHNKRKTCSDGLGRTNSTFEPDTGTTLGLETDTIYDPLGNILSITQKGGSSSSSDWRVRSFIYDGLSRMTQSTAPESGTTSYAYTTTGGLCSGTPSAPCKITDARGVITTLTYDALSRLTGKTYSDSTPAVTYHYDQATVGTLTITNPNGLRTSMTDGSGSTAWSYDPMGRVATRQQTISTVTKSIGYTYNLDGSVATLMYPSGRTYTYTYNNAQQISTLKDIANSINFFSSPHYAPPGMLTSAIHGAVTGWNAITLTNLYNDRLQLSQTQAVNPLSSTLLNLSYSYDLGSGANNGSVASITNGRDSSRSVTYTYDLLNRLATAQSALTWGNSYVYDPWGNLYQKNVIKGTAENMTLVLNNKNQVTSPAFTYDLSGNLTWDTTHALGYDAEGRMNPASGLSYTYDGDNRRVMKSDGTIYWMDDQLRPLSVGTTGGAITRDYIFIGSKRIAMVPLSSGNPYYYLSDHLGSTAVIASGDGKTIQWDADYFPFGAVRQLFTNTVGNNFEFTGYENDSETAYNYANARYDAGRWGRFLSPDPYLGSMDVRNPQSLNRYAYAMNRATVLIDPSGLQSGQRKHEFVRENESGGGGGGDGCMLDGIETSCDIVGALVDGGAAVPCPNGICEGTNINGGFFYYKASDLGGGYFTYSGPGMLYYSLMDAGTAAAAALPDNDKDNHEYHSNVYESAGFYSYSPAQQLAECQWGVDCETSPDWDDHPEGTILVAAAHHHPESGGVTSDFSDGAPKTDITSYLGFDPQLYGFLSTPGGRIVMFNPTLYKAWQNGGTPAVCVITGPLMGAKRYC